MSLRDHHERSGTALFRWRSYPPLLLVLLVVAVAFMPVQVHLFGNRFQESWEVICLLIGVAGLAIRAWVIGHVPQGTSGRNTNSQIADVLNTTGLYSLVRHPLYVGNFLMWLGPILVLRSPWAALVMLLAFWLYYERIMYAEEEFLRRTFGEAWTSWAARTPAVVPSFKHWTPDLLPFSLRNVLKREYSGVLAVALGFAFADWVDDYSTFQRLVPDTLTLVVLGTGAVAFVVLRTLKKRTTLLEVTGR